MAQLIAIEKALSTARPNDVDDTQIDHIFTIIFTGSAIPDPDGPSFETDIVVGRLQGMSDSEFEAARAQAYRDFALARWNKVIGANKVHMDKYIKG